LDLSENQRYFNFDYHSTKQNISSSTAITTDTTTNPDTVTTKARRSTAATISIQSGKKACENNSVREHKNKFEQQFNREDSFYNDPPWNRPSVIPDFILKRGRRRRSRNIDTHPDNTHNDDSGSSSGRVTHQPSYSHKIIVYQTRGVNTGGTL
jgi:hypothetical protein